MLLYTTTRLYSIIIFYIQRHRRIEEIHFIVWRKLMKIEYFKRLSALECGVLTGEVFERKMRDKRFH